MLYDEGKGVTRDSKAAVRWWREAAAQGNIKATVNLAFAYEDGRGVERDAKECARLFGIAAEAGEPTAQVNYGRKLFDGEAVAKRRALGWAWIVVAAESERIKGMPMAEKLKAQRDKAWGELSVAERLRAEELKRGILGRVKG